MVFGKPNISKIQNTTDAASKQACLSQILKISDYRAKNIIRHSLLWISLVILHEYAMKLHVWVCHIMQTVVRTQHTLERMASERELKQDTLTKTMHCNENQSKQC